MGKLAVSNDKNSDLYRFIATGNEQGKILLWRIIEIKYMDQPCAELEYEGNLEDIQFLQDSNNHYNVLLSLHSSPNKIIITNLRDFKPVRKI